MQSHRDEERAWETDSGVSNEPGVGSVPDQSDEIDAQASARSEDDEDTEEFLSPSWD